jgi:hypothetical protein
VHQRRPGQADLRRSLSTSYYALVHGLAELAAGRLVGNTSTAQKSAAWSRVYRDLNHLTAKKACSRPELQGCSQELARFLMAFPQLQELRHQADYDPTVRFKQGEALSAADDAERGLSGLQDAPRDEQLDFITIALGMTRS